MAKKLAVTDRVLTPGGAAALLIASCFSRSRDHADT